MSGAEPVEATVSDAPKFPLIAFGDVNAAACEGDSCLVPGATGQVTPGL